MTHTPGPWKRRDDSTPSGQRQIQVWRHEPNELPITSIATIHKQPCPIEHGDHVANAALIAAAPELLEALRGLLESPGKIRKRENMFRRKQNRFPRS